MIGLSNYVVQCLICNQIIQKDEEEIYLYGVQLFLNTILTMLWIFAWGFVLGKFILSIIAMACLVHLRQYAGGYHADSYLKCFLLSNLCFLLMYLAVIWKVGMRWPLALSIASVLATIYLVKVGTTNHPNNPKTSEELKERAMKARINTLLYSGISLTLLKMGRYVDIATVIIVTQICTSLSVRVLKLKKGDVVQ